MVETSFFGGAHVDTEARPPSPSAMRSLPVGKPEETDDRITVVDIDRLLDINDDRVCACLNCLDDPPPWGRSKHRDRFPALRYLSCRVEGCTWKIDIPSLVFHTTIYTAFVHDQSHFREESRNQDQNLIYTCKDDRCQIRTKRKDGVK